MAQLIQAPGKEAAEFPSVFLAGGIHNCPDWQRIASDALREAPLTIFNPRREAFPEALAAEEEQIRWEFERLRAADLVSFWFPKETLNPITLFEFGAAMERAKPLIVGIDPAYERRSDIEIQMKLRHPDMRPVYSLEDLIAAIRDHFKI